MTTKPALDLSAESGPPPNDSEPLPVVSIIVPCRNEEVHIAQCLDSILASDYPQERLEILVIDGMSEDRTRTIVEGYASRFPRVRLVDNLKKHIPEAFNLGVRNASGDSVMLMSAHSTCHRNYVRSCVEYQEKYHADNVGGVLRILPRGDTAMARAIALALGHRFGSGNARVKIGASQPTWSDSAALGCFKKELFTRIGMFDERLKSSSDLDMNMRIRAAGGRILLVPEIVIEYYADATLGAFRKHNFADGVWATYVLKFGSKGWSWRHWVPLAFVLSLLGSFALSLLFPVFFWVGLGIAALYLATSLFVSLQIAIRAKDFAQVLLLPVAFAVRHFAHGAGALLGVVLMALPGMEWKGRRRMEE